MRWVILKILKLYQKLISPIIHSINGSWGCRFYPSCSDYSYQTIEKYGLLKGFFKSLKRIIKCHPFNKGGYDPC